MGKLILYLIIILSLSISSYSQESQINSKFKLSDYSHKKPEQSQSNYKNKIKSNKSQKWNWDTIIAYDTLWGFYRRYTQTFNSNGLLICYKYEERKSNDWSLNCRNTLSYDAQGKMLDSICESCNNTEFGLVSKYSNTYYSDGKLKMTEYFLRKENDWKLNYRSRYNYDTLGYISKKVSENWSGDTLLMTRIERYTNDTLGNKLLKSQEFWEDTTLLKSWDLRYTYNVDSNKNLIMLLIEGNANGIWENSTRNTYSYDSNGNLLSSLSELWVDEKWNFIDRHVYVYDMQGFKVSHTFEQWQDNSVITGSRSTFINDSCGNAIKINYEDWNYDHWEHNWDYYYTYDKNGNSITEKACRYINGKWIQADNVLSVLSQGKQEMLIFDYSSYLAHWMDLDEGIIDLKQNKNQMNVYPNPMVDMVNVKYQLEESEKVEIKIYNILGEELGKIDSGEKVKGEYEKSYDAKNLKPGVYFVRMMTERGMEVVKMVKE